MDYGIRGMHLAYDLLAGVDLLVLVDTVPPDDPGEQPRAASGSCGSARKTWTPTRPWTRTAWIRSQSWAGFGRWAANCP